MSKAMPERALACWGMRHGHYIFGQDPRTNEKYVVTTFDMDGGTGAVWGFDGHDGPCSMGSLGEVLKGNAEELEMRFPWRMLCWEFAADTCGAGQWRGGAGVHRGGGKLGGGGGRGPVRFDGGMERGK